MMNTTPLAAIRANCLECSGGSAKEARLCPVTGCALWPFRFGKRPDTVAKEHPHRMDPQHVRRQGGSL